MLILRELYGGPAKFGELDRALPGAATNLLTDRLRRLEQHGLVRRVGSESAPLYAATELSGQVRPALEMLGMWGATLGPVPGSETHPIETARSAAIGSAGDLEPGHRH